MSNLAHSRLSDGPPCTFCDFIVAVLGSKHSQDQRPVLEVDVPAAGYSAE